MAKQSNLEILGMDQRGVETRRSAARYDFTKNDPYTAEHDKAQTHEEDGHPWGKGTNSGGHTATVPDSSLGKDRVIPQIDTTDGGGSYDKFGRTGIDGGRNFLVKMNLYNENNAYGPDSVDTSANRDEGQYFVQ